MKTAFHDLVTITGELIRLEMPSKFEDEVLDDIDNARRCGDWWCPGRYDGCTAVFMGMHLNRVDMKKIIGMLD
jgi:hypothetical protein